LSISQHLYAVLAHYEEKQEVAPTGDALDPWRRFLGR
jgi:hypothetical protein